MLNKRNFSLVTYIMCPYYVLLYQYACCIYHICVGCDFGYLLMLIPVYVQKAKLSKEYPSHHSSTSLMNLMAAIQATLFALCVEKNWNQWKLPSAIRVLAALYSVR